jgi:putative membrane protein
MKTYLLSAVGLLCMTSGSMAAAQTANPAGAAPDTPNIDTGHPPDAHANTADQLFIKELGIGGMAEAQFGKLAAQKAQNSHVKEFARRMVDDHGKANDKLPPLARAAAVPLRKDLDMDHRVMQDELNKLTGATFDAVYIRGQVREHQKTAQLLEWEIGSGQDARVRNFAMQLLPVVVDHLEHAQALQAELTGSAVRQ